MWLESFSKNMKKIVNESSVFLQRNRCFPHLPPVGIIRDFVGKNHTTHLEGGTLEMKKEERFGESSIVPRRSFLRHILHTG